MRQWDTVAIVGVGLIGGSIGLALRQRGLAENDHQRISGRSLMRSLTLRCEIGRLDESVPVYPYSRGDLYGTACGARPVGDDD